MKFSTLLVASLTSTTLAIPIISRALPLDFTPRVGVTIPKASKNVPRAVSDRLQRASVHHDDVLKLMDFVAVRVQTECNDIHTAVKAAQFEGLTYEATVATVRSMDIIRTLLSKAVSRLDNASKMDFTPKERQQLIDDIYIITNVFFDTTKDYVKTLGGAEGGRSLSRAAHMLTDVLDSIVTIDSNIASDMSRKLTPVFSDVGDEEELLSVIVSSVRDFLSSIKVEPCSGSDCSSDQNEELR
ncbi:hypothetical protein NW752_010805 [Fusarium irregulare]|uniref:Uncharacterized protein n=1 Tax=Fusarium irregulare TaxID=2494466 RepID=A0A9W8U4Q1_9HYPO|nr:hypothetical protein NW766_011974 [Fusarium irregulare]KAJ4006158.1 hypothetical protein NW752_010805 [Fusarium irregulare]